MEREVDVDSNGQLWHFSVLRERNGNGSGRKAPVAEERPHGDGHCKMTAARWVDRQRESQGGSRRDDRVARRWQSPGDGSGQATASWNCFTATSFIISPTEYGYSGHATFFNI